MTKADTQAVDAGDPQDKDDQKADTPTDQPSEASKVSQDAPEDTQEEVEAEADTETEVKTEDTADEKLFAGKYKTQEELEKAYQELESKFGKETSEKAELNRVLSEVLQSPAEEVETDEEIEEDSTAISETEKLKRDTAVLKFIVAHGEADAEAMKDVLANDPLIAQIPSHEARLEYAYLRTKDASQAKAMKEAEKATQEATKAKIAEKEVAQVESAKKAEPADEGAELMTQAMEGTPDEREAARKAIIKKHLANL